MKYKIECKSLLLQKALEGFLREYLSDDGIIIGDESGDIVIGKDIKKPFSKSQLLIQLEALHQKNQIKEHLEKPEEKLEINMDIFDDLIQRESIKHSTDLFEEKLDKIIEEFSIKLKNLIKEEYGKE